MMLEHNNFSCDFSWMIGGPQGSGVDSSATLFIRACALAGLYVFGKREYHSNIMGEHSYFHVRVSNRPVHSHIDPVHLLVTFDLETAKIHADEVVSTGYFFYDEDSLDLSTLNLLEGVGKLNIPYRDILEKVSEKVDRAVFKLEIMKNTVAVAVSLAITGLDISYLERALKSVFGDKKKDLIELNMIVAREAYAFVHRHALEKAFPYKLSPASLSSRGALSFEGLSPLLFMNGATACALGKLKAGCRFQSYYPITPASDESVYLEARPEYGTVVVQAEDEVAAVCMAVGAAVTGIRASTSTSGPGFGLMMEGLGWAGMNEVPVVIFNYQRGGPSTGLPTRHEQGDLLFTLSAGHGEFPRIVLAPGDMTECFHDAFEAFNDAEQVQLPVIVLCDKALANNTQTIAPFDESQLVIQRGKRVSDSTLSEFSKTDGFQDQYPRFADSEDGVSPRPFPGQQHGIYWMTGDEHDRYGHITEDPINRLGMQDKRMRKLRFATEKIPESRQWALVGPDTADYTIVSWGSTKGPILDAMRAMADEGISINFLQIRMLSPFPVDAVTRILEFSRTLIDIEMNYTAQLAKLIRMETGIDIHHRILKWTGRPISETEIVSALREIIQQHSEKVVLHHGK